MYSTTFVVLYSHCVKRNQLRMHNHIRVRARVRVCSFTSTRPVPPGTPLCSSSAHEGGRLFVETTMKMNMKNGAPVHHGTRHGANLAPAGARGEPTHEDQQRIPRRERRGLTAPMSVSRPGVRLRWFMGLG